MPRPVSADGAELWVSVQFHDYSANGRDQMAMALSARCPLRATAALCWKERDASPTACHDVPNSTATEDEQVNAGLGAAWSRPSLHPALSRDLQLQGDTPWPLELRGCPPWLPAAAAGTAQPGLIGAHSLGAPSAWDSGWSCCEVPLRRFPGQGRVGGSRQECCILTCPLFCPDLHPGGGGRAPTALLQGEPTLVSTTGTSTGAVPTPPHPCPQEVLAAPDSPCPAQPPLGQVLVPVCRCPAWDRWPML